MRYMVIVVLSAAIVMSRDWRSAFTAEPHPSLGFVLNMKNADNK